MQAIADLVFLFPHGSGPDYQEPIFVHFYLLTPWEDTESA